MRRLMTAALFVTLFGCYQSARAQEFNYDAYEPRTLAGMVEKYKPLGDEASKGVDTVFGHTFPSRVKVKYDGAQRKISAARKSFVEEWTKTRGLGPEVAALFEHEYLFTENSVEHWLPAQKQVAAYFAEELKKGDEVTLFAIIVGGQKVSGKWDWMILVNEFEKYRLLFHHRRYGR